MFITVIDTNEIQLHVNGTVDFTKSSQFVQKGVKVIVFDVTIRDRRKGLPPRSRVVDDAKMFRSRSKQVGILNVYRVDSIKELYCENGKTFSEVRTLTYDTDKNTFMNVCEKYKIFG